jgi:hypothetical protein
VSEGIRQSAGYAAVPQKYNESVSRAWVEAVPYHVTQRPDLIDFDDLWRRSRAYWTSACSLLITAPGPSRTLLHAGPW